MPDPWNSTISASEPLTEQMLVDFFKGLERQAEAYHKAPKGPCGCPACCVSPKTRGRLEREGGYAQCANCFRPFYIDPHA